ncbi:MAG: arylsulfatase [Planctomycetota bacterium]|jgi:arylsulfatase
MLLRRFIWLLPVIFLVCSVSLHAGQQPALKKPNIVLIMADDMGFSDIGCYGSEIATPVLDKLAGNGLRFTQFYNTARCCPTRAALLTGLYQHQAGIGHMVGDYGLPAYRGFLNDGSVTIAEALSRGGYRTLMSGKWHVGEERPHWPVDRGFDSYFGLISGGSNYFRLDPGRVMAIDDQSYTPLGDDFYMTDAFSDRAVEFIEKYGGDAAPFFLYVAYTAPHWPLHAWHADIAKYRDKYMIGWDDLRQRRHKRMIELGIVGGSWPMTLRDERVPAWTDVEDKKKELWDLKMSVYAAQIDRMDQGIGKIVTKLVELGEFDNTLIMFLADNGGCAERLDRGKVGFLPGHRDSFTSYGIGWANASNTPFRLYKHWVHEGGISTPLIVHWPSLIKRPGIVHQVGHVIDIMATCLDVAGVRYPKSYKGRAITPLAGRSLVPIFRGKKFEADRPIFWEHEGNRAVRLGKWKLVSRYPGLWELYDLRADRTEMNDLAGKNPEKVKELASLYSRWAECNGVLSWNEVSAKAADIWEEAKRKRKK